MHIKGANLDFFENKVAQEELNILVYKTLINEEVPWSILFRGDFNCSINTAPMYRIDSNSFEDSYGELF